MRRPALDPAGINFGRPVMTSFTERTERSLTGRVRTLPAKVRFPVSFWSWYRHAKPVDGCFRQNHPNTARPTSCGHRQAWAHRLAAQFRLQSPQLGRNRNLSLQDHRRPASSSPNSAQLSNRGEDWMQRSQSNDRPWHAGHHPGRLIPWNRHGDAVDGPLVHQTPALLFVEMSMSHDAFDLRAMDTDVLQCAVVEGLQFGNRSPPLARSVAA